MSSVHLCLPTLIFVTSLTLIKLTGAEECNSDSDCYDRVVIGLADSGETECCNGKCAKDCSMLVYSKFIIVYINWVENSDNQR